MDGLYDSETNSLFKSLLNGLREIKDQLTVIVVANIKETTSNNSDYVDFSVKTEFFNESELEEIVGAYRAEGFFVKVFTDEIEFINAVISGEIKQYLTKLSIVYNTAQKGTGPGRKSLIPAFCNMMDIPITGSNAYVVSLCRNKYHYNAILKQYNLQISNFWIFHDKYGWINNIPPPQNQKVIVKPIYESASIGVDNNSVIFNDKLMIEKLLHLSKTFAQPIIVQEFIEGYEVEVPVINCNSKIMAFGPIGISLKGNQYLGDRILTYDIVYNDEYNYYDFNHLENDVKKSIKKCSEDCVKILGIEGFGRVDFRITLDGKYYITDIATSPHITHHSSYYHLVKQLGFNYSELPLLLLCTTARKLGWI